MGCGAAQTFNVKNQLVPVLVVRYSQDCGVVVRVTCRQAIVALSVEEKITTTTKLRIPAERTETFNKVCARSHAGASLTVNQKGNPVGS